MRALLCPSPERTLRRRSPFRGTPLGRALFVCIPTFALCGVALAHAQTTDRLTLELGVDSFAQIFRITDDTGADLLLSEASFRDTTDVFTELRAATDFLLQHRAPGLRVETRARVSFGTDLIREDASFDLRWEDTERTTLDLDLEAEGRQFREDSDFALSSDNATVAGRFHLQHAVSDEWKLGTRLRTELIRYRERSIYEIDNHRADLSLTAKWNRGWSHWVDLEAGFGRREVPDSTQISYDRGFARGQVETAWGERLHFSYAQSVERRSYEDAETRSPYWNLLFEPELRVKLADDLEIVWRSPVEWLDYDNSTSIFFDTLLARAGTALRHRIGSFEWSVEPRWSWLSSPDEVEDEYRQPSVVLRFDWFGTDRWWFSFTEEIGERNYPEAPEGGLDLYSDYTFFRTSFVGSVRLSENLTFDAFVSDEPEVHRRDEDDARLTLVTASLRFSF